MKNNQIKKINKRKNTNTPISYNPSPYLRKVIEENEILYLQGKTKTYRGVKELLKTLKS